MRADGARADRVYLVDAGAPTWLMPRYQVVPGTIVSERHRVVDHGDRESGTAWDRLEAKALRLNAETEAV